MGVQHVITAGTAQFVERFSRIFKWMVAQRVKELKWEKRLPTKTTPIDTTKIQWSDLVPQILPVSNHKNKHRRTGMTPAEAKKPSSEADAKMAMEMVAIRGRTFPILQVGDIVIILKKKKVVGDKEFMEQFKVGKQTVESISDNFGQNFYMLSDKREYTRSDIAKMIN